MSVTTGDVLRVTVTAACPVALAFSTLTTIEAEVVVPELSVTVTIRVTSPWLLGAVH
jgi:hypothetical protein